MKQNKAQAAKLVEAAKRSPRARVPFGDGSRAGLRAAINRVYAELDQLPRNLSDLVGTTDGMGFLASADAALDDDGYGVTLKDIQYDARRGLEEIIRFLSETSPKQAAEEHAALLAEREEQRKRAEAAQAEHQAWAKKRRAEQQRKEAEARKRDEARLREYQREVAARTWAVTWDADIEHWIGNCECGFTVKRVRRGASKVKRAMEAHQAEQHA